MGEARAVIGESAALAASLVWAAASLLFTRLGDTLDARTLNFAKTSLAAALLWITLWFVEGRWWPDLTHVELAWLGASGFVGLTIGDTAIFRALTLIGPRRTLVVWSLVPPTTAALAVPCLGEGITWPLVFGMALTIAGVLWVVTERTADVAKASLAGIGFAVLSMLCQSSGNILVKLGGASTSALSISVVRLVVAAGFLALLVGALGEPRALRGLKRPGATSKLLLATFLGTYLGIWLSMAGLRYAPAAVAATLGSLSPVFVLPFVWAFDGERPSARAAGGACLAVGGVAVLFLF